MRLQSRYFSHAASTSKFAHLLFFAVLSLLPACLVAIPFHSAMHKKTAFQPPERSWLGLYQNTLPADVDERFSVTEMPSVIFTDPTTEAAFAELAVPTIYNRNNLLSPLDLFAQLNSDPSLDDSTGDIAEEVEDEEENAQEDRMIRVGRNAECFGYMVDITDYLRTGMAFLNEFCRIDEPHVVHPGEPVSQPLSTSLLLSRYGNATTPKRSSTLSEQYREECCRQCRPRPAERLICTHVMKALLARLNAGQDYSVRHCQELVRTAQDLRT